jgi:hypothetical protein
MVFSYSRSRLSVACQHFCPCYQSPVNKCINYPTMQLSEPSYFVHSPTDSMSTSTFQSFSRAQSCTYTSTMPSDVCIIVHPNAKRPLSLMQEYKLKDRWLMTRQPSAWCQSYNATELSPQAILYLAYTSIFPTREINKFDNQAFNINKYITQVY